jgi:hypothetical protein
MLKLKSQNGVSLVAAIAIITILAIFGVVLTSMIGVTTRGDVDYMRSAEALAFSQAGLNWYKMQLKSIEDWSTTTAPAAQSLGQGTFQITILSSPAPTRTQLRFTSTGILSFTDKDGTTKTVQRRMTQTVRKAIDYYDPGEPPNFCLFWGRNTGIPLTFSTTSVTGNIWAVGGVVSGNPGAGAMVYHPTGTSVPGGVNHTLTTSVLPMPVLDTTFFNNYISSYGALIAANTSSTDLSLTTSQTYTVTGTVNRRNIIIRPPSGGTINIVGNGTLVANGYIYLNDSGTGTRTLNITPSSGGRISFLANGQFNINSTSSGTRITRINQNHRTNGNSSVNLYCRSDLNSRYLIISNANSYVEGAMIIGNRRVIVNSGADVYDSTFFVNFPGDMSNNYLQVTGSGTIIGDVSRPCTLLSFGQSMGNSNSLVLDASVSVTGFVYQWNSTGYGYIFINGATVRGVIYADAFRSDTITGLNLTGDQTLVFDRGAEFQGFSTVVGSSWDDGNT